MYKTMMISFKKHNILVIIMGEHFYDFFY